MAHTYFCTDGDMLDQICWKQYGTSSKAVEIVLAHPNNRHLADLGECYVTGTLIYLPDIPTETLKPKQERIKIFTT